MKPRHRNGQTIENALTVEHQIELAQQGLPLPIERAQEVAATAVEEAAFRHPLEDVGVVTRRPAIPTPGPVHGIRRLTPP